MYDKIEKLGRSLIQHGKSNDRIYLMKLHPADAHTMPLLLEELAGQYGYTKIFTKIPASAVPYFTDKGYIREASIPRFFRSGEDVFFVSKFTDVSRFEITGSEKQMMAKNISLARQKSGSAPAKPLPAGCSLQQLTAADTGQLADLYREVFPSYPFPIHKPAYLAGTMESHIIYFGICQGKKLIAASSSETDSENRTVEMTDFATLPDYRGQGLALNLLNFMEQEILKNEFLCHYTIARAFSAGMNITFAKAGYQFSGTLINNTDISGNIESMNVWYKHCTPAPS